MHVSSFGYRVVSLLTRWNVERDVGELFDGARSSRRIHQDAPQTERSLRTGRLD